MQLNCIVVPCPNARTSSNEDTIFIWIKFEILWENCMEVNCESVTCSNGPARSQAEKEKNTYEDIKKMYKNNIKLAMVI